MKKKDQFMMFISVGAVARDMANRTSDAAVVATAASRIPEEVIPPNVRNAATTYFAFVDGKTERPLRWLQLRMRVKKRTK